MAQSINLQITPNGVIPTIYASQFDVGREIIFNLYDGSTAYTPPVGSTIRFEGKKSDGNGFSYNCTYVDNVVTVVLTDQMTVFAEEVPCELRIADLNANDIGTLNILLSVEKSPIDGNTPMSDTEIPAIVELARAEQYSAEAWAEGTRNGVPVGPTDPTYQNNAKYYAEHSSASVSSLSDTDIQNVADNQILVYDGVDSKWENKVNNINRLADVHILNPSDGQSLIYDAHDDKWVNGSGGGSSTLGGLTDVTLTTPTNGQILKYDAVNDEWVNGDAPSGGAGGSEVTITTVESSLYGQTVTISDGQDTYTGTFDNTGLCIIQGVTITGSATVTSTDGIDTATGTLTMPYFGNYSTTLSFFSATVNVTFPYANGATCTLSDGVTTLTANTSPMAFTIPNTGTWVATCTLDGQSKTQSFVITTDGQTESHTFQYGTINLTFDNEFRGLTVTCANGGTVISKTAPISGNTMAFYPPSTGEWIISATYSGVPYSTSATVVSLATAVSAILQTAVVATVTLHGAAGATITWEDANGVTQTATLDNNGEKANVTVTAKPSLPIVTFEDTTVSKNPADLTANYKKAVVVSNTLTDIYVMPLNSLYWYGYVGNFEEGSSANGWTQQSSSPYTASTWNTNYIQAPSGNTSGQIGNKTSISNVSKYHCLYNADAFTTDNPSIVTLSSKASNSFAGRTYLSTVGSVKHYELASTEPYVMMFNSSNCYGKTYGVWYNGNNDYNFYSAANDVVTFKDSNNNDIVFAITDENGGAYVDYSAVPNGSYTLTSSIAKNPDDLSQYYSKTVSITNATTEVYLMPSNVLYWWGYYNGIENLSAGNGWSGGTYEAPSHSTNYIDCKSTGYVCGIGSVSALNASKIIEIAQGITINASSYGGINIHQSKNTGSELAFEQINDSSIKKYEINTSNFSNFYISSYANSNRENKVYALWYE